MYNHYKVPIENGKFVGISYDDIIEGVAFNRHAEEGFGYIMTEAEYPFEEVTPEVFEREKVG